ncbi:hypothetical protein [Pedobacter cryoconitis]|uniref:Terminase n=1 Tax=Pedobacter cryoconitis TaxID=188932 RepID=A0A327SID1_9SPHI|nr:hypothetical protein [Pedobacter cryoconitis]RAJ28880.1 hypothetical protein LY11_03154 [Pedobacter cryoconitis]
MGKTIDKSKSIPPKKLKAGRPTKYKVAYNKLAYNYCLLGAVDAELAKYFEISESALNVWKKEFPSFMESIKKGKETADATVASKLFQRANGYQHPDVDIKMFEGEIIETKLTKHYPPDTTAAIFWLKNRQPKKWRDKQEIGVTDEDNKDVPLVTVFRLPDNGRSRV